MVLMALTAHALVDVQITQLQRVRADVQVA